MDAEIEKMLRDVFRSPTDADVRRASKDSLRLIVESQVVLNDLEKNQAKLENLLSDLGRQIEGPR